MLAPGRDTARETRPDEPAAAGAPRPYTVLVVDDQPETLRLLTRLLEREGYEILCAPSGQEALILLADRRVHVMVVDYVLPDMTGAEVIEQSRALDDRVQIVLQTGYPSAFPPRELLRTLAIQGLSAGGPQTAKAKRPPGASQRERLAKPAGGRPLD